MSKTKKTLIIGGIALDVIVTIFLFVVSILMLAMKTPSKERAIETNGPFIGGLQANPTVFLLAIVLPLVLLLIANIVILVVYIKKAGKAKEVGMNELDAAQKEALRAELLKELSSGDSDKE